MLYNLERDGIAACPDDPARVKPPADPPPLYSIVHARIKREAEQEAITQIKEILASGEGVLESFNSDGFRIVLNATDIFDEFLQKEEGDDLALAMGAAFSAKGKEKLESMIKRLAQSHAQCVADATTSAALER